MNTKLTLRLNKSTVDTARKYAELRGISLSNTVEAYLLLITKEEKTLNNNDIEISPFVKSMISTNQIPADFDYKTDYKSYLTKKYE